jgi:DNA-directed RNA polymerase specialized sigma24 family protein
MEFLPSELELCDRIANRAAGKFRSYNIDSKDLASELRLWLCENYPKVLRYRGENGGMGKLYTALTRHWYKYLKASIIDFYGNGYANDGRWSTTDIVDGLRTMNEAGDKHNQILTAFLSLSPRNMDILQRLVIDNTKTATIASERGISAVQVRVMKHEAINSMKLKLSMGEDPYARQDFNILLNAASSDDCSLVL